MKLLPVCDPRGRYVGVDMDVPRLSGGVRKRNDLQVPTEPICIPSAIFTAIAEKNADIMLVMGLRTVIARAIYTSFVLHRCACVAGHSKCTTKGRNRRLQKYITVDGRKRLHLSAGGRARSWGMSNVLKVSHQEAIRSKAALERQGGATLIWNAALLRRDHGVRHASSQPQPMTSLPVGRGNPPCRPRRRCTDQLTGMFIWSAFPSRQAREFKWQPIIATRKYLPVRVHLDPRSASLRIICGSTLRRLQAQFLNAYSTLPCPPLPSFAAEIGVCHRAHPRSAAALRDLIRIHFKAILSEI